MFIVETFQDKAMRIPGLGLCRAASLAIMLTLAAHSTPGLTAGAVLTPGFQVLHKFDLAVDGGGSFAAMTLGTDGNLYGTTAFGGGFGSIFRMSPAGKYQTIYSFSGLLDGYNPGTLVQDRDGTFVGTACGGGTTQQWMGEGTVFRVTTGGVLTVLHAFSGPDGACPLGPVVIAEDGSIFGVAQNGGANGLGGTIFKIAPDGSESTVHSFHSTDTDGAFPSGGLIVGPDGDYYGSTEQGGTGVCYTVHECGTIFKVSPQGALRVIYNFQPGAGGEGPTGPLAFIGKGSLVGTAVNDGSGNGVVFRVSLTGKETVLHAFTSQEGPSSSGVVVGLHGMLYGATGFMTDGILFQVSPKGVETVLHSLDGSVLGGLTVDHAGRVYGTTSSTIFRFTPGTTP